MSSREPPPDHPTTRHRRLPWLQQRLLVCGSIAAIAGPVILALAILLAGCTVGPDYQHPAAPAISRVTSDPTQAITVGAATVGGTPQALIEGRDIPGCLRRDK